MLAHPGYTMQRDIAMDFDDSFILSGEADPNLDPMLLFASSQPFAPAASSLSSRMPSTEPGFLTYDQPPVTSAVPTPAPVKTRRKPVPRKGHTKSRRGCLNCKRRRVKCPESYPECDHCQRLGLRCEWPEGRIPAGAKEAQRAESLGPALASSGSASSLPPSPTAGLQVTPMNFSGDDMRFFHHFLFEAYPSLPINGECVWREVAPLAHTYDYLIHAMLALGATHLALGCKTDYSSAALGHRIRAINALNRALDSPCSSKVEGDARFATILSLTFQSSFMADGMQDFVSMLRGCTVVSTSAMLCFEDSAFRNFSTEGHVATVKGLHEGKPVDGQDIDLVNGARRSIREIGTLCKSDLEMRMIASMEQTLDLAEYSAVDAFTNLCRGYHIFGLAGSEEFKLVINPVNYTSQILLLHWFLIEFLAGESALLPVKGGFPFRIPIISAWTHTLVESLPKSYLPYMQWPLSYIRSLQARDDGQPTLALPRLIEKTTSLLLSD